MGPDRVFVDAGEEHLDAQLLVRVLHKGVDDTKLKSVHRREQACGRNIDNAFPCRKAFRREAKLDVRQPALGVDRWRMPVTNVVPLKRVPTPAISITSRGLIAANPGTERHPRSMAIRLLARCASAQEFLRIQGHRGS